MTPATAGTLAVLALVDSMSVGTLGLPTWLLLRPTVRPRGVLLYLGVLAAFYWVIGAALVLGISAGIQGISLGGVATAWLQLLAGAALLVGSFVVLPPGARGRALLTADAETESRWERSLGRAPGACGLTLLALAAGVSEVATMLPYLAATGVLAAAELPPAGWSAALAGYVVVMCLPALALVSARAAAADALAPLLARLDMWLRRHWRSTLAWLLGVVGVLVGLDALGKLVEAYGIA
jgi:hypothetical protein